MFIGPYELQDFNNFYITRFGYLPTKVAFLAYCTWRDKTKGLWPDISADKEKFLYFKRNKKMALRLFISIFQNFPIQTFLRSQRPKSRLRRITFARGDYRAPSDSEAECLA